MIHLFRTDELPYSLSEVLRNNYDGFITSDNYLQIIPIPENVKINSAQKNNRSGVYWTHKVTSETNYQSPELRDLLDQYDNGLVVCCIETRSDLVYLYGNSDQPLKMLYRDLDPTNPLDNIGHEIILEGETYNSPKIIPSTTFYSPNDLASWLASPL